MHDSTRRSAGDNGVPANGNEPTADEGHPITIDLDELERLASAATPGPWEAGDVWVFTGPVYADDRRLSNVLGMPFADEDRRAIEHARGLRNAEHIAAADPQTVLALIERVRRAEAAIAEIEKVWHAGTEQGDSGLNYKDDLESTMDDIWDALADCQSGADQ